jgi:hypothetical protein
VTLDAGISRRFTIWSVLFELAITVLAVWLTGRVIAARLGKPSAPAEPKDGDYAGSPARLRPRPHSGAGAIALAEPDDEDNDRN